MYRFLEYSEASRSVPPAVIPIFAIFFGVISLHPLQIILNVPNFTTGGFFLVFSPHIPRRHDFYGLHLVRRCLERRPVLSYPMSPSLNLAIIHLPDICSTKECRSFSIAPGSWTQPFNLPNNPSPIYSPIFNALQNV
jgi:hypothetical protein